MPSLHGDVVVHVRGLHRDRGPVLAVLFDADGDTSTREPGRARHVASAPVIEGEAAILFRDVDHGRYVASLVRRTGDTGPLSPTHPDVVFDARGSETHVGLDPHERLHAARPDA